MKNRAGAKRRAGQSPGIVHRDLHPARLLDLCTTSRLARTVVLFDSIGSTNLAAMEAGSAGAPEGMLFISEEQRLGRGRKGREWLSVRGKSLTFSLLLRPVRRDEGLTAIMALSAVTALGARAVHPRIKWPNDVFLGGKKVGGILAEAKGDAVVIGMGLNVNERPEDFPAAIADEAVSLRMACGRELDRGRVLCRIIEAFERLYERFEREGFASFRAEIEEKLLYVGGSVTVETGDEKVRGKLLGITDEGHIRIAAAGGERVFASGELTVRGRIRG